MNWQRMLHLTNYFLLLTGFQLHRFEPTTHRFRLSLLGVANFIVLTLFYVICVNQHFAQSPLLKIFYDVSPFFWQLIRAQILLGLKVYVFRLFAMPEVGRACDGISRFSTRLFARKFSVEEAVAYLLIFSTVLIALCFALYIAYEMEFKLPPWDNIFIGCGLFVPQFALAGALKLYTLNCWLMREELRYLKTELEDMLAAKDKIETKIEVCAINGIVGLAANDAQKQWEQCYRRLEQLAGVRKLVSGALDKELLLLLVMNSSCLLTGVYALVYFETSWHLFFCGSWKRIFYAANIAIYVLVCWDYLCLFTSVGLYNKVKSQLLARIQVALKSENGREKCIRAALKSMRNILALELRLKLFNAVDVSTANMLLALILLGIIIALVVTYQYFYDQIVAMTARLDSVESDD